MFDFSTKSEFIWKFPGWSSRRAQNLWDFRGANVHSGPKMVKNVEVEGSISIWGKFYRFLSNFRVKK